MRDPCAEVGLPGYRIVAQVKGQTYEYRSTIEFLSGVRGLSESQTPFAPHRLTSRHMIL